MSGWSGSQQSAPLRLETAATGYERYQPAEQLQRGSGGYSDHVQPPVIYRDDQYSATGVKLDRTAVTTASPVNMPTPLPDTVSVPSQPERPAIYGLPPAPVVDEPLQILDHGQPAAQRMAAAQMLEIPGPVDSPVARAWPSAGSPDEPALMSEQEAIAEFQQHQQLAMVEASTHGEELQHYYISADQAAQSYQAGQGLNFPPPQYDWAPPAVPLDPTSTHQFRRPGSSPGSVSSRPFSGDPAPLRRPPPVSLLPATAQAAEMAEQRQVVGFLRGDETAVASFGGAPGYAPANGAGPFVLGAGDVITMNVYNRDELTTTAIVSERGKVVLPLIGEVAVGGQSPAMASRRIAEAYQRGEFLVDPQINVVVAEYRSQQISVLGEVQQPGRFPVETRLTVLDALALAGGLREVAGDQVHVLRPDNNGGTQRITVPLSAATGGSETGQLFTLRAGDSVVAPKAETFYIYGEVRQPNAYRLQPNMTVIQALSIGGGLTERGSDKRVQIKRRGSNGQLETIEAALNTQLRADDVIYVKERLF